MTAPARNDLLDALAKLAGMPLAELGKYQCKRLQKCLNIIKESSPDVDLPEMRTRFKRFVLFWPGIKCTPEGLAKRWPELSEPVHFDGGLPGEPEGWRTLATDAFPEMEQTSAVYLSRSNWGTLSPHLRAKVIRFMAERAGNVVPFREDSA